MEANEKLHLDPQKEVDNSELKADDTQEIKNELNSEPENNIADTISGGDNNEEISAEPVVSAEVDEPRVEEAVVEPEARDEEIVSETEQVEDKPMEEVAEDKVETEVPAAEPVEVSVGEDATEVETEEPDGKPVEETEVVSEAEAEPAGKAEIDSKVAVATEEVKAEESSEEPVESALEPEKVQEESDDENEEDDSDVEDSDLEKSNTAVAVSKYPDYSTYSEVDLINELRGLLEKDNFLEILDQIDVIKASFYKKHKIKLQEEKKKFIDEGGFEEAFTPKTDPYEQDLKTLLLQVKQKKTEHSKDIEAEKDENLRRKYEIIEEIKNLINRKESINKTFQEFRDLQQNWREIGLVPQSSMKDLWENYHHHVENFYDYIKINKELRDLDLKRNMEEKIGLCEKAEALLLEPSVIKAFNALQKYHDLWREIGPVPRDKKEELWERFKSATTLINKKHQDFFENRKKNQKKNLEAKTALCEKVEEILEMNISNHKDWEDKSKELVELQKYWRTIGFAPKRENNLIYERFRKACDSFFDMKREFYSKHKEIQSNNLQLKIDLCVQAEALKESTDWKKTTEEFINIQKKWKEIGPVPRKQSDIVWKRFRSACDYFFKQKSSFFNSKDSEQLENLKLKNELIAAVENFKSAGNDEADFEKLRDYQRRWTEIGHVPIQDKNDVQKRFRDAINVQFDKLRVEDKDRNLLKFRSKMSDWKTSSKGHNKMFAERDKYVSKLRQLESDLVTLKNNIGFFADSKNAEALIKDVERKIANNEEQIIYLKEKIRVIDDVDYNEE